MAIEAVAFRVVVKPDTVETKTASGLLLAVNEAMERNAQICGTIIQIGEDAWSAYHPKRPNAGLQVGDRVYFAKYSGKWIKRPTGEELLVINDEDIVAKEVPDVADTNIVAS